MTAKEMFEEIGYHRHSNVDDCLTFTKKQGNVIYYIEFYLEDLCYETYGFVKGNKVNNPIDLKMNSAIQEQLRELGWTK